MTKVLEGIIVSTKMDKTVVIEVERKFLHRKYKKVVKKNKKLMAHNEGIKLVKGDRVEVKENRPISKHKHFTVVKKITVNASLAEHPRLSRDKKKK